MYKHWLGYLVVLAVFVAGLARLPAAGSAAVEGAPPRVPLVTITEFPLPTAVSQPYGITAGPDGNLWFTENQGNKIGRMPPTGAAIVEFPVPTAASSLKGITAGSDGNLWFTEQNGNKIGRITTAGTITEFTIPTAASGPLGIAAGPDGNLWFTEYSGNKIGRITTAGTITEFVVPATGSAPLWITAGPDGNLWFTEAGGNEIGRITPAGTITEFTIPTAGSGPQGITAGPDGNLWFTEFAGNQIGRITTAGTITEFVVPTTPSQPAGITAGPDGNLWFAEFAGNKIGRITTAGTITEFPVPTTGSGPQGITAGPDSNLWFTEQLSNKIGRLSEFAPPPTATPMPSATSTPLATETPGGATATPNPNPTSCPIQFTDVPEGSTFYPYIRCLACRHIVGGYTTSPPCSSGTPCFLPQNNVTRGQIAKFVSNAANYQDVIPPDRQTFTDVPPSSPFWLFIERAYLHEVIAGYTTSPPCTTGTPCFLPGNNVTRGQTAKFVSNAANYQDLIPPNQQTFTDIPPNSTFWLYIERAYLHSVISGYTTSPPCTTGTPCFLPANSVTRGQTAKFISNAFFPDCITPVR